jgi:hypothetical protein
MIERTSQDKGYLLIYDKDACQYIARYGRVIFDYNMVDREQSVWCVVEQKRKNGREEEVGGRSGT